jgi:hypothetical protein
MLGSKERYVIESDRADTKLVLPNIKISIVSTQKDFKDFYRVPWNIYKNDRCWVPPLWEEYRDFFKKKNPFWSHAELRLFIARKNSQIVGRIAVMIDSKFCEFTKEKTGYFGFFECIPDFEVAKALFKVSEEWLASKGMSLMRGPINGRVDVGCGFLLEGFDSTPSILSSYSPEYYLEFTEKYGFKKSRDLLVYNLDLTKPIPNRLVESARRCKKDSVKIRRFSRIMVGKEVKLWTKLFLDTFSEHWGFVPVSDEEIKERFGIKQARWFVDPKLFLIAEVDRKPIAYICATPDYNQIFKKLDGKFGVKGVIIFLINKKRVNRGKLNLIGCLQEYRNREIASYLNYCVIKEMKKRGYKNAEIGWVDEQNRGSIRIIEKMGAELHKKFRVFEKNIQGVYGHNEEAFL